MSHALETLGVRTGVPPAAAATLERVFKAGFQRRWWVCQEETKLRMRR